jgi:hypothetical protein
MRIQEKIRFIQSHPRTGLRMMPFAKYNLGGSIVLAGVDVWLPGHVRTALVHVRRNEKE